MVDFLLYYIPEAILVPAIFLVVGFGLGVIINILPLFILFKLLNLKSHFYLIGISFSFILWIISALFLDFAPEIVKIDILIGESTLAVAILWIISLYGFLGSGAIVAAYFEHKSKK